MDTYRAAYLIGGIGTVLTVPEEAHLSDDDLIAIARGVLEEIGVPESYASIDEAMKDVEIGEVFFD